jgi:T4-like virus tail tube protein gp19
MGAAPPPVQTVTHISVTIDCQSVQNVTADAMNNLLFSSCSPPDWSIDAPKHVFHGQNGTPETIISSVQNPQYGTMTLTQGWDPGNVLAHWMNQISDPTVDMANKKGTVTVVFMDSKGTGLFQWVGTGAILTGFSHTPSDASSNGVLTITATIDADTWKLCAAGGTTPL